MSPVLFWERRPAVTADTVWLMLSNETSELLWLRDIRPPATPRRWCGLCINTCTKINHIKNYTFITHSTTYQKYQQLTLENAILWFIMILNLRDRFSFIMYIWQISYVQETTHLLYICSNIKEGYKFLQLFLPPPPFYCNNFLPL